MNRELRDKWLTALRSGEYEQSQERLLTESEAGIERFCCLGVLCVVAGVSKGSIRNRGTLGGVNKMQLLTDNPTILSNFGPEYDVADDFETKLTAMNDSEGMGFVDIANWIEKSIPVTEAA